MLNGTSRYGVLTISLALLVGCAASSNVRESYVDPQYTNASFGKYLVIGVAGSYNNRAQFERTLVSAIRNKGTSAIAYYNVVPGNEPLDRDSVIAAASDSQADAVLVTRVLSQQSDVTIRDGSAGAKASVVGGRPVNFFRYDYEELNEPATINLAVTVTLVTELFSAADETMIWAIETSISGAEDVNSLIDQTAAAIADKLDNESYLRRNRSAPQ